MLALVFSDFHLFFILNFCVTCSNAFLWNLFGGGGGGGCGNNCGYGGGGSYAMPSTGYVSPNYYNQQQYGSGYPVQNLGHYGSNYATPESSYQPSVGYATPSTTKIGYQTGPIEAGSGNGYPSVGTMPTGYAINPYGMNGAGWPSYTSSTGGMGYSTTNNNGLTPAYFTGGQGGGHAVPYGGGYMTLPTGSPSGMGPSSFLNNSRYEGGPGQWPFGYGSFNFGSHGPAGGYSPGMGMVGFSRYSGLSGVGHMGSRLSALFLENEIAGAATGKELITTPPAMLLPVSYGETRLSPGERLHLEDVKTEPNVTINGIDLYTLLLTDMDGVDQINPNGTRIQIHHWVVINIPGGGTPSQGQALADYSPPAPPEGTGSHRYVFLLFRQHSSQLMNVTDPLWVSMKGSSANRQRWTVRVFRDINNLDHQPTAGNFFRAEDGY